MLTKSYRKQTLRTLLRVFKVEKGAPVSPMLRFLRLSLRKAPTKSRNDGLAGKELAERHCEPFSGEV